MSTNDKYNLSSSFTYVIPFRKTKIKREVIGIKALYKPRSGSIYVAQLYGASFQIEENFHRRCSPENNKKKKHMKIYVIWFTLRNYFSRIWLP